MDVLLQIMNQTGLLCSALAVGSFGDKEPCGRIGTMSRRDLPLATGTMRKTICVEACCKVKVNIFSIRPIFFKYVFHVLGPNTEWFVPSLLGASYWCRNQKYVCYAVVGEYWCHLFRTCCWMPCLSAKAQTTGVTKKEARGWMAPNTPTWCSARWGNTANGTYL